MFINRVLLNIGKLLGIIYLLLRSFGMMFHLFSDELPIGHFLQVISSNIGILCNLLFVIIPLIMIVIQRISVKLVAIVILLYLPLLITFAVFPKNSLYLTEIIPYFKFFALTLILVNSGIYTIDYLIKYYILASIIASILIIYSLTILYSPIFLSQKYMVFSNALTVPTGVLLYSAIIEKNKVSAVVSIVNIIALIICSARGGFLSILLLILLLIWIRSTNKQRLRFLVVISISIVFVSSLSNFEIISSVLNNFGIESHIFGYFSSSNLMNSSGRNVIFSQLLNTVSDNPMGLGLAGDRVILEGGYAHNIFLEFFVDFGVILGTILSILLIAIVVKTIFSNINIKDKGFICIWICLSVFQLIVSRSWMTEDNLFFYIALFITYIYKKDRTVNKLSYESKCNNTNV